MIIVIANQKGGVAKTTTVLNLGAGLSREFNTLLIDLDSQTDLTISLGLPNQERTINDVMQGKDITKSIYKLDNLSVIPADKDLKAIQLSLNKSDILFKALATIKKKYDYILIDTNPGMTILTINALLASDLILIPVTPEYLALSGLKDFKKTIEQLKGKFDIDPLVKILITNFDKRKKLHREAVELIREYFKDDLLKTIIRTNVALAESVSFFKTIYEYKANSHGSQDYDNLTKEVIKIKGIK
ncbi:MAG: ParA family protein [Caldisericia bacterium]|jgi:chromosome partitioning protein|nr:ParA family protein [Caldisericia bacterium]